VFISDGTIPLEKRKIQNCNMSKIIFTCLISLGFIFLSSCQKDYVKLNDEEINDYLSKNNLQAEKTSEGLYYIINEEGTGDRPTVSDRVTVHYSGYLTNGTIFDSSYDRGQRATFPLSGVIKGWQMGIPKIKEGGSCKLIIPSHLAYGANPPSGSIPKNAVLIFDIELFEVN
jgi:FKBP-type peptidyl-prolyl cis-trans isomerase FkpA